MNLTRCDFNAVFTHIQKPEKLGQANQVRARLVRVAHQAFCIKQRFILIVSCTVLYTGNIEIHARAVLLGNLHIHILWNFSKGKSIDPFDNSLTNFVLAWKIELDSGDKRTSISVKLLFVFSIKSISYVSFDRTFSTVVHGGFAHIRILVNHGFDKQASPHHALQHRSPRVKATKQSKHLPCHQTKISTSDNHGSWRRNILTDFASDG